jgi:serine protease Do
MALPARPAWRRGRDELTPVLPIATLRETLDTLARAGKVARGWLGVHLDPAPPQAGRGVRVMRAIAGQPAANAGSQDGDVILEFGGKKVTHLDALRAMVAAKKPGQRVAVKILRANEEVILEVTLGEQARPEAMGAPGIPRPEPVPRLHVRPAPPAAAGGEKLPLGITVQTLTPELAAAFGFGAAKGLVVTAVEPNSPAAKARPTPVQRGDLLKEIARKPVTTLAEAKAAIEAARKAKAKTLILLVRNKDGARYLLLDLPK